MRLFSVRHIRKVGSSAYVAMPKIVRHELGISVDDQVEIELDTVKKILIVRPLRGRVYVPLADPNDAELLPFAIHEKLKQPAPAASEPADDGERVPA